MASGYDGLAYLPHMPGVVVTLGFRDRSALPSHLLGCEALRTPLTPYCGMFCRDMSPNRMPAVSAACLLQHTGPTPGPSDSDFGTPACLLALLSLLYRG